MRLSLAAIALIVTQPAWADVLVENVDGLTLGADGTVQRFSGLLIDNNGRIQQIFLRNDKRPARTDYRLDGKGRVLMPGLIDSHVELMKLGFSRIPPATPGARPRPEDRDRALVEAQKVLLERGITAAIDMGTTIEDWQSYRRAGDQGTLTIRIIAYAANTDAMSLIGGPGPTLWLYDDRLRLNGVQIVLDGPLESRAAALKAPYTDAPALKVPLKLTEIQLKNLISRAGIDHFQVAVEAHGDKANAALLDALAELSQTYKGERRWRIEQAQFIDPADLARLNQNGVAVSMQPQQLTSAIAATEARLGPQRIAGTYAWKSVTGSGAHLAFGSGAPNAAPDAFAGIAAAITRQGADAQPFGGWQAQERLTREAALAAYTTGAAWAAFGEGRIGRIAIGQRADFLLVDHDPLLAAPGELRSIKVLQTWVGGKLVYQAQASAAVER
ncbi:MAG: amidohydrolase family protein [Novosphingobium sp.]